MNKWVGISDFSGDFWGDAWLAVSNDLRVTMVTVKIKVGDHPLWYSHSLGGWFKFRSDLKYLIMPVEYPKVTEEDFK